MQTLSGRVAAYLDGIVGEAAPGRAFATVLIRLLTGPTRPLDPTRSGKWPRYVTETALALGGDPAAALRAAAAVVCVVAAADVVDDLVDGDYADAALPAERALNGVAALPWLAARCVGDLRLVLGADRATRVGDILAEGYLLAAAGEDADLCLESAPDATEEAAHAMTAAKSGGLASLACRVGAAVATVDPAILDLAGDFGTHCGVVAQLLNDLAGIAPGDPTRRGDLRRRKKTLPVAYALRCAREEDVAPLIAWYVPSPCTMGTDDADREETIARLIGELGGHDYAALVADAHRREALAALRRLLRRTGRPAVGTLRRLVAPVRWRNGMGMARC